MAIAGKTTDGKRVVSGLFNLVGTYGLPVDVLVEETMERGIVIDMADFIDSAKQDGWKDRTIVSRFSETRLGSDPEFMSRLSKYLDRCEP